MEKKTRKFETLAWHLEILLYIFLSFIFTIWHKKVINGSINKIFIILMKMINSWSLSPYKDIEPAFIQHTSTVLHSPIISTKAICALYSSNLCSITELHGGPQPTFHIQKTSNDSLWHYIIRYSLSGSTVPEHRWRNSSLEIKVLGGEILTRLLKAGRALPLSYQESGE